MSELTTCYGELRKFTEWLYQAILEGPGVKMVAQGNPERAVSLFQRDIQNHQDPYYVVIGMPTASGEEQSNCFFWGFETVIALGWDAGSMTEVSESGLIYMDFQWKVLDGIAETIRGADSHYRIVGIESAKDSDFDRFRYLDENHLYSAYKLTTSAR